MITIIFILTLIILICLFINKKKETFTEKRKKIKIAIQTVFILKENLPFLEEWIVYHKKIGVDKFYLYDNTGSKYRKKW